MAHHYEFTLTHSRANFHKIRKTSPYVRCFIEDKQFYRSTIVDGTNPEWNEQFSITNVEDSHSLRIEVWNDKVKDRLMGSGSLSLNSELYINDDEEPVDCQVVIQRPRGKKAFHRRREYVHILVKYLGPVEPDGYGPTYTGLPRFEIHNPVASGLIKTILPKTADFDHYITNTLYLAYVEQCFEGKKTHWNTEYEASQVIFGQNPKGKALRLMIHAQITALFSNNHNRDAYFACRNESDFFDVVYKETKHPRMFTYSIIYDGMRFTETGTHFFRNFLSKHTMLALCNEEVYFAGEFHVITENGEKVLVIDNNSGTYAPAKEDLPKLKELFKRNFPNMRVEIRDKDDERTKEFKQHYGLAEEKEIDETEFNIEIPDRVPEDEEEAEREQEESEDSTSSSEDDLEKLRKMREERREDKEHLVEEMRFVAVGCPPT